MRISPLSEVGVGVGLGSRIWRFGAFELDASRGELRKDGRRVRLKPQPRMLLAMLLENQGQLITRQQAKETLWPDEPAYRTDENLNHVVKRLREALGDSGQNPRFVATIRNNGYRFLADAWSDDIPGGTKEHGTETLRTKKAGAGASRRAVLFAAAAASVTISALFLIAIAGDDLDGDREPKVVRATLPLEGTVAFGRAPTVAISPDGQSIAYVARSAGGGVSLYIHDLASEEARLVPGSNGARLPFFSPDGAKVGFVSMQHRRLMEVATEGGAPRRGREIDDLPYGAAWTASEDIVLAPSSFSGLVRLSPDGSTETLTTPDRTRGEKSHRLPEALPGGRAILFTLSTVDITSFDDASIAVVDLETGRTRVLIEGGTCGRYSPSGHIVYWRGGSLYAAPFDLENLRVTGSPRPVQSNVTAAPYAAALFAIARNGTLVYAPGPPRFRTSQLAWIDRTGTVAPIITSSFPIDGDIGQISLSRGGDQVAFAVGGATDHIWVHDVARQATSRLTFTWDNIFPAWSPDGRRLAFWSNRGEGHGIFVAEVAASTEPEALVSSPDRIWPTSWSSDGSRLLIMRQRDGRDWDIGIAHVRDDEKKTTTTSAWLSTSFNEVWPLFSPDDRWIVYESDESGRNEIYVRSHEGTSAKFQISTRGGHRPRWGPGGREIFYWEDDRFMAVDFFDREGRLAPGTPRALFENDARRQVYDVAADGERFVMSFTEMGSKAPSELRLVLNWAETLK